MLSKNQKLGIVLGTSLAVGVLSFFILKNKYSSKIALSVSVASAGILIIIGLVLIKKNKEGFMSGGSAPSSSGSPSSSPGSTALANRSGCSQTINIYQNCAGGDGPAPSPSGNFSPEEIKKWMLSVKPELTAQCQECSIQSIMKLWNADTLNSIISKPKEDQEKILNAILAFDCQKQCVIPANVLDENEVTKWVLSVMPNISDDCKSCAVSSIVKLWSSTNMITAVNLPHQDQVNLILAVLAANCPKCESANAVSEDVVKKWLNSLFTGSKPECLDCIQKKIMAMWDISQFNKVLAMDKSSQIQVLQALIALNCEKDCITVPSGLVKSEVMEWVASVMPNAMAECQECAANSIVKLWTPSVLDDIKKKSPEEVYQILNSLIVFNCEKQCFSAGFLADQIKMQIQKLFPGVNMECLQCISGKAAELWGKDGYMEFIKRPTLDQAKIIKAIGDFHCAGICMIPPIEESNYMA